MRQELQAGRKVNLNNFGIFKTTVRAARTYKAPFAPGMKPVKKPARTGINFKPAQWTTQTGDLIHVAQRKLARGISERYLP